MKKTIAFFALAVACLVLATLGDAPGAEKVQPQPATTADPLATDTVNKQATGDKGAVVSKGLTSTIVTVPANTETQSYVIDTRPLIEALMPYIASAFGSLLLALGAVATAWLKQKFNIDIQQKDREAYQTAATNAAGMLIAIGGTKLIENGKIEVDHAKLAQVANMMIERVPDALRRLGPTPEQMRDTIIAKVPQVLTPVVPVATDPKV